VTEAVVVVTIKATAHPAAGKPITLDGANRAIRSCARKAVHTTIRCRMRKATAEVPAAETSRTEATAAPASATATTAEATASAVSTASAATTTARHGHVRRQHANRRHRAQRDHRFTQHVIPPR
jgi:hypothetical protein